jgi:hypothetical protein
MLEYKTVNVCGRNLTDRFVDANKINDMAKDGWKLVNITVPPVANNNFYVCGTFVREKPAEKFQEKSATNFQEKPDEKIETPVKRGPGRPPKAEVK